MEDCNNIIEGILYLKGDEGIDIKRIITDFRKFLKKKLWKLWIIL